MQRRWAHWALAALAASSVWWLNRAPQSGPSSSPKPFSGTLIPQIGHAGGIRAFALAPDAQTVATLGETIKFWDVETGALRRTLPVDATIWQPRNLRFSPQGHSLAFLDDTPQGTTLHLLDVASGRSWFSKVKASYCRDFAFAQETQVCLNTDSQLLTYDIKTRHLLRQTRLASGYPWGAVADGVALSGWGNNWKLCDLRTNRSHNLKRASSLQAAAFSANGRLLATGQNRFPAVSSRPSPLTQNKVRFSLLNVEEERRQIKRSVVPSPPVAPDGTLALWDTRRGTLRRVITAFPAQVGAFRNVALSPDGRLVAAYGSEAYKTGYRAVLKQWDSQTGQLKGTWLLNTDGFLATTMAIADDGTMSVAGLKANESGVAGAPQVWNTRTCTWLGLEGGALTDTWKHLEWSPDGKFLAGGSKIGMASRGLWGNLSGYYYSSYSLSGAMPTFIFTGAVEFEAQTVRLWDLEKGRMHRGFWGPIVPPRSTDGQGTAALQQGGLASLLGVCAFSPDSRLIATDEAGAIVLRDAKTGAIVRTLAALPARWSNIGDWSQFIWSPQSDALLAITSPTSTPTLDLNGTLTMAPATLTLWNPQNGRLKAILGAHSIPIQAAFAADGQAIVALLDQKPHAWDITGAPLNVAALPSLPHNAKALSSPILTRQGQLMRAVSTTETTFLETREILTGKLRRFEFPSPFNSKSLAPRRLFVAPDGTSVGVLQANHALALWNLAEWKLLGHVPLSSSHNIIAAPAPGGRLIAVAAPEGAIQVFDPAASSSPLNLQVFPARQAQRGGQDWAVFSENFFAASPQASGRLQRMINGKMLPLSP